MKKIFALLIIMVSTLAADEGMWPLNMVPAHYELQELEYVQKSCLRLSAGGSGSFVSPHGLVLTNHHVARGSIYEISSEEKDFIKDGFLARSCDEELSLSHLFADQLISIVDVTTELKPLSEKARKAKIATLCSKAMEETGLQPQVVTLYKGALYHLYLYKRYTDIRLVMAPERAIAFFGGDNENFEYPRHNLDVTFLRIYENGKPLEGNPYLPWSSRGPVGDEPLFVVGNPGKTDRILTPAHLAFLRDVRYPLALEQLEERIACLMQFSEKSEEHARIAQDELAGLLNTQKVFRAVYERLTLGVERNEESLELNAALTDLATYYKEFYLLEYVSYPICKYFTLAKHIVRMNDELQKPNEERLTEYRDSELEALKLELFSTEPIYHEFEMVKLNDSIQRLERLLGADHPVVKNLMVHDFETTLLGSIENRRADIDDPFIALARAIDPYTRALRERYEAFSGIEKECYSTLANINKSPDATFTLRISRGLMAGYIEDGRRVAPYTTFASLCAKATSVEPYLLPDSWQPCIPTRTPMNFVSTHDIIGGNSGSPVVNAQGEVVGLIFDGNRHAFVANFFYDDKLARAISVHSQGILEALKKIYKAQELVEELRVTPYEKKHW